ncbi:Ig-like domain-containing protein [Flavobacterium noncentrifugens]|uniref:Por secretion system C-terminal sorting domain-containing protein n=1 Tax=Flavobacterium noncentrifugens TaxID=1128970 RepID=A0A1G8RDR2_9FLAO|nr:T9SS type A sorting domain-containing protein [Flavobacterium noncentrifugens]SDJ15132.1 Por secretion system C-terminal sorting domain-containing protein [Flavobacterium noncentrifugens]
MKTTKKYTVVWMVLLFAQLSAFAQYHGGLSDGAALSTISNATCSQQPPSFFAYFGGEGDTATVAELISTSCSTPPSQIAYMGGQADGAAVAELGSTVCGIPPSFFAYMGGESDGAAVSDLIPSICGFPPSFIAYFGGAGSGAAMDVIASCPITPPVANFTASTTTICVGNTVTFTDTSASAPSVWNWSFPGGTPATSTEQNPTVQYNSAGVYSVTLVATNFNGSNTKTISDLIAVTAVPTVLTTTPGSRCDTGIVALSATASAGTLKWYNVATGGSALGTGVNFNTPSIAATTTYYVEAAVGTCASVRTAVIATVNATPSVAATTPNSRCDSGSVNLSATASAGTLSWFAASTGGTALGTGTTFATPIINATTTFYVQAANGTCISPRTAVIATVNATPTVTATTPGSRCDSGTVVLSATANTGTLNWYNVPAGGSVLATGNSFTTPSISATTTYYVEATTGSCASARTAVIATANVTPAVNSTTPAARCDSGSVTLAATATAGTLRWYNVASGGLVLASGNSFATPSVSATTTYYVEAVNGSCLSARTAVIATVNATPTVTSTMPGNRCGNGIVTLQATASAGTLNWYSSATGGTLLATGTSFSPNVSATTTYYVGASNASCNSARTAVIATVNAQPEITATTPGSRCDSGIVNLSAVASSGTVNWYNVATGGAILTTGSSFAPSITATTIFYVEAVNASCSSGRIAVLATVNVSPIIVATTAGARCNPGAINLSASSNSGTISWYNSATGGTALATGNSFSPNITATTIYYVEAANGSCVSPRIAVAATINAVAAPTGTQNQTFCGQETVGLIVVNGENVVWYDAPVNGNVVPNNTPIVSGTTYYASQTVDCESQSRLAVTMTSGNCLDVKGFDKDALKVYPNPVSDILNISYTQPIENIEVVNMLGQMVYSKTVHATDSKIDMSRYSAGTYLVRISIDNAIKTYKVIKK